MANADSRDPALARSAQPWHALDVDAVLRELAADPTHGLSPEEAARRLANYGPNELTHEEKASPWLLFFNQFKNVLILILIVATVLSAFVGEYVDAIIILVIIVFCAVLGFVQEYRAERALDALEEHAGADDHRAARRPGAGGRLQGSRARRRPGARGGRPDPGRRQAGREPLASIATRRRSPASRCR